MVAIQAKPKKYGPLVVSGDSTRRLELTSPAGSTLLTGTEASSDILPPGDLLMAALGACLGISLQMAADALKVETGEVTMTVEAFIDGAVPRRFERFEVGVSMPAVSDRKVAAELLARAKRICTVSHSLNADITLELKA